MSGMSTRLQRFIAVILFIGMLIWVIVLYNVVADSEASAAWWALALQENALRHKEQDAEWFNMKAAITRLEGEVVEAYVGCDDAKRALASCTLVQGKRAQETLALYRDIESLRTTLASETSSRATEMRLMVGDLGTEVIKGRLCLLEHVSSREVLPLDDMRGLTYSVGRLFELYQLRIEALEAKIAEMEED